MKPVVKNRKQYKRAKFLPWYREMVKLLRNHHCKNFRDDSVIALS